MKLILAFVLCAMTALAQSKPEFKRPDNPFAPLTGKEADEFVKHFERVTITGTTQANKAGLARIDFIEMKHPDGFMTPPSCTLTRGGKPADISRWGVTDNRAFTTFYVRPKEKTDYICKGWMRK